MEPLTMFASTVGFIGFFHLLSQAVERFGKGNARSTPTKQRDDWYCFFAVSDLLGVENTTTPQTTLSEEEQLERIRRHHARRPRLQA